ncbi:MAG: TRAP transporter substrate-binding protein DctP [Oscillospiraceae bacterium]|nr:TRAP transporter substrate-binding protein DctP [Oscillospiraceae bacterium]
MKRLIALAMTLALALSLAACGNSGSTTESTSAETTSTETTAAETTSGEDASSASEYSGESFTIYMASDTTENSDQNAPMVYFRDLVAEKFGGAVTVEVSWGGTEYDNAGIWGALQDNLLNMDIMLMNKHTSDAPLMNWGFTPFSSDAQEAIDQTNYLIFENETTSQIIADYMGSFNMTILGNSCDGAPSFITTFEWDTLDDLVAQSAAFGTMNTAKYQALGLNCNAVPATDAYDNLSRGIIDGVSASLATAITNSLYEVAPYATVDGQYTSAVLIVANTDFWAGLSEEAQALIQECVDATSAYSAEHVTEATVEAAETWEAETGNAVKFLEGEDGKEFWAQTLAANAANAEANASGQSYEEDMKTLLTEWVAYQEEYHGIDIDWEW